MSDPWPSEPLTLAALHPEPWTPSGGTNLTFGGCFVCFPRIRLRQGGRAGLGGAVAMSGGRLLASARVSGGAGAPYRPGFLAARKGALPAAAVQQPPDVLLVNATGCDHPRGAGLALQPGRRVTWKRPCGGDGIRCPGPDRGAVPPGAPSGQDRPGRVRSGRGGFVVVAQAENPVHRGQDGGDALGLE